MKTASSNVEGTLAIVDPISKAIGVASASSNLPENIKLIINFEGIKPGTLNFSIEDNKLNY